MSLPSRIWLGVWHPTHSNPCLGSQLASANTAHCFRENDRLFQFFRTVFFPLVSSSYRTGWVVLHSNIFFERGRVLAKVNIFTPECTASREVLARPFG